MPQCFGQNNYAHSFPNVKLWYLQKSFNELSEQTSGMWIFFIFGTHPVQYTTHVLVIYMYFLQQYFGSHRKIKSYSGVWGFKYWSITYSEPDCCSKFPALSPKLFYNIALLLVFKIHFAFHSFSLSNAELLKHCVEITYRHELQNFDLIFQVAQSKRFVMALPCSHSFSSLFLIRYMCQNSCAAIRCIHVQWTGQCRTSDRENLSDYLLPLPWKTGKHTISVRRWLHYSQLVRARKYESTKKHSAHLFCENDLRLTFLKLEKCLHAEYDSLSFSEHSPFMNITTPSSIRPFLYFHVSFAVTTESKPNTVKLKLSCFKSVRVSVNFYSWHLRMEGDFSSTLESRGWTVIPLYL